MKRVALYGGSFDPPHIGHEAVVKALKKLDFIQKVIVMPTFLNPFKESFTAPASLRLKWLQCIFADDEKVKISSFEVDKKRKVPAIESVQMLKKQYEKIFFIIGADNLASLQKWHRYEELHKLVTFIVATRDKIAIPKDFLTLKVDRDISSSELRKKMDISKLPKRCAQEIAHYYKYKEHNAKEN